MAESCFATLEYELLRTTRFASHREAQRQIADFIDEWNNPVHRHSTLGSLSAMKYEQQLRQTARAA